MRQGVIPNRFPDAGETPEYNTADATLWMFQAMRAWLAAGGDRGFLRGTFYPAAKEIIDWHRRGTLFNIGVDPEDHLLHAGAAGTQLTWMDAKVGDQVVTPRHGKPVEINALWHEALSLMADWAEEIGEHADYRRGSGTGAATAFARNSGMQERGCLYDVLTDKAPVSETSPQPDFRGRACLDLLEQTAAGVVRIVERELLTPVGLRTLERGDPDYKPRYEGSPAERDGAYHQGTVWPWLMGPFIDAYLMAFPEGLAYCRELIEGLESADGSIAEIYDGDEPRRPAGCPVQAWSVAEVARVKAFLWPQMNTDAHR